MIVAWTKLFSVILQNQKSSSAVLALLGLALETVVMMLNMYGTAKTSRHKFGQQV